MFALCACGLRPWNLNSCMGGGIPFWFPFKTTKTGTVEKDTPHTVEVGTQVSRISSTQLLPVLFAGLEVRALNPPLLLVKFGEPTPFISKTSRFELPFMFRCVLKCPFYPAATFWASLVSLPEFVNFKLFGKTILVVNIKVRSFFGPSTRQVRSCCVFFLFQVSSRTRERHKPKASSADVPPQIDSQIS